MRIRTAFVAAGFGMALLPLPSPLLAEGLELHAEFKAARRALQDGLPAVAGVKATRLLGQTTWDAMERVQLATLAAEGWVRAKEGKQALAITATETVAEEEYWQAHALMLTGDGEAAVRLLRPKDEAGALSVRAQLLLAQILITQGDEAGAGAVLKRLTVTTDAEIGRRTRLMLGELDRTAKPLPANAPATAGDPQARYLVARNLMESGWHPKAQEILRGIVGGTAGGERVHHAATVLLAESLLRQQKHDEAIEALTQFLDNTLESPLWKEAFDLLGEALEKTNPPTAPPDAALRWITDAHSAQRGAAVATPSADRFRGYAMFLAARWLTASGRTMEALGLLEAFLHVHPSHPRSAEALRMALSMYGTMKADARVTALANQWRRRFGDSGSSLVGLVTGRTAYERGEFKQAHDLFSRAAEAAVSLAERRSALYNAGIAAIRAGETALYQTVLGQLNAPGTDRTGAADLELDKAMAMAAKNDPAAEAELMRFVTGHATHLRRAEALIALAETRLMRSPPDFAAVAQALHDAESVANLAPAVSQRIAYTRLWLLDRQNDLKAVTEAGARFLKEWPAAGLAPDVRMKVADAFYRLENFASARTEFELVAKEYPTSPYADTALYFAGMSAVSMIGDEGREAAISLWQEVAERGGPLRIAARQQQALAKRRAGDEAEALKLFDALLADNTLGDDTRRSLTCEKAEVLIVLGKTDPAQLSQASKVLLDLLNEAGLPGFWRARAGMTLAAVLDAAGSKPEALEACYDVVQSTAPTNPAEYHWYYKAGFFGIELLEADKQWEAAARLGEKLALTKGNRATEAKERATKIRLEHFLWDGK